MMRDLLNVLPDERPVTSLCVVEDPSQKPAGFHVVHRTYDQDVDADLWKEGFFGKKITRYLCLSKSEGRENHVIDSMTVINDRELPPEGFTALTHTADSEQKATKKRLICYRTMPGDKAGQAITDIIVLSKSKKAPTGFTLAGDMNGFVVCFKATSIAELHRGHSNGIATSSGRYASYYSNSYTMDRLKASNSSSSSPRQATPNSKMTSSQRLPYPVLTSLSSNVSTTAAASIQGRPPLPLPPAALYPVDQLQSVIPVQPPVRNCTLPRNMGQTRTWAHSRHYAAPNHQSHLHQQQEPSIPRLPLPPPPPAPPSSQPLAANDHSRTSASTSTNSGSNGVFSGLEGIVFEVNPRFKELHQHLRNIVIPSLDCKTFDEIEAEFKYDFRVERLALQRRPPPPPSSSEPNDHH